MSTSQKFLKMKGVDGDSTQKGYEDWIELLNFSSNARCTGSGNRIDCTQATEITISMRGSSKYSARLMQLSVSGALIPEAAMHVLPDSGNRHLQIFRFTGLTISSHTYSEKGDWAPLHTLTLGFESMRREDCSGV